MVSQKCATESSNIKVNCNEQETKDYVARESVEGSKTYDQSQKIQDATKFSNADCKSATDSSNSTEKQRRERDSNPRGPHGPQAI